MDTQQQINNGAQATTISLIYLNNSYEVPLLSTESLEEFLEKASVMLQVDYTGFEYLVRDERGNALLKKEDLYSKPMLYLMLVRKDGEFPDCVFPESDNIDDEDFEPVCLTKRPRVNDDTEIFTAVCKKIKRAKGQKRRFVCPFDHCRKIFTETGNLKTHIRTHTGERPFECEFEGCDKKFITKGHLKSHELIHTGDKPFVCDFYGCNKKYSRSGRLKIHRRTHTGERPFICPHKYCGKTFTEKGNLKTHLRIHSGEKPYVCPYDDCAKTFTTQGHLNDHQRSHSGERPFECNMCDKKFMRSSTLKIHYKRHNKEKASRKNNNASSSESYLTEQSESYRDLSFIEKNNEAKRGNNKRVKTEESNLFIPMVVIDQAVQEHKQAIVQNKDKSPNTQNENYQYNTAYAQQWQNFNGNTPASAAQMRGTSPLNVNRSFHILNFCTSPMGNISNSPNAFSAFNMANFYSNMSNQNSPNAVKQEAKESEYANAFKPVYTNPFENAFMKSPTAFSPFAFASSPSFLGGSFLGLPSFSHFAQDNVPGTPSGLFSNIFGGASCKNNIIKSKFHNEDFESASTKSPDSENIKMDDLFEKSDSFKNSPIGTVLSFGKAN